MSRYVAKPRGFDWGDDEPCRVNPIVDEPKPVDTGLVTAAGIPIIRLPNPVGFGRDKEW